MMSRKISTLFALVLSLLLVGCFGRGNLRGTERQLIDVEEESGTSILSREDLRPKRKLQARQRLFTTVINSLISVATPTISEKLIYVATKYYNNYDFTWLTDQQFLGDDAFLNRSTAAMKQLPSICDVSAGDVDSNVLYDYSIRLKELDGIGTMSIDKIAYVEGSQEIDLFWEGLRAGANWAGQWHVETAFDNLTALTETTVTATVQQPSCGDAMNVTQTMVNGTVLLNNVRATTLATVVGGTGRLTLFVSTSEIASMTVDSMALGYDPIDTASIGSFNSDNLDNSTAAVAIRNLDDLGATAPWEDNIEDSFGDYGQQLLKYTVEDELNWILPRPFILQDDGDV